MVRNYSPDEYMIVYGGRTLTGLGSGNPITASKTANTWETHVGVHGEVARSKNLNPLGQITVTLTRTSPDLAYMLAKSNSNDIDSCYLIDRNNQEISAGGSQCWIQKIPDLGVSAGDNVPEMQFVIIVSDFEMR